MRCGSVDRTAWNTRWHLRVWGPSDDSPETHTRFGIIPILPRGASVPLPRAEVVRWFSRCVYRNSQSVPTNEGSDLINKKKRDRSPYAIINLLRRYCDKRFHFKLYKRKINTCSCTCIFQNVVSISIEVKCKKCLF